MDIFSTIVAIIVYGALWSVVIFTGTYVLVSIFDLLIRSGKEKS